MADREVRVKIAVVGADEAARNLAGLADAAGATGQQIGTNLREGIERGLNQAENAADQAGDRIGDNIGDGIVRGASEGSEEAARNAGASGDQIGSTMADMAKKAIIGAGIGAAFAAALDAEDGNAKLQAQLGLTVEEAGRAGALAGELWTSNYAGSMEEARDLTRSTIAALGDYSEDFASEEVAKFAGYASNLATITGEEADSVLQLVSRMMRTGLTNSVEDAFDIITKASQKTTAGMQGDLLDVGNEYAGVFAQVGFDGSEAFAMLAEASKDGAIQMDKVGDSVKEFTLLATNLDDTGEAYEALGLKGRDMANALLRGGEDAQRAFLQIVNGLNGIEDPADQAALAIRFFGTPLEDLGTDQIPSFLDALSAADDGLGNFRGAAEGVDEVLGNTLSGRFATARKEVEGVGQSVAASLLPAFEALLPIVQWAAEALSDISALFSSMPAGLTVAAAAAVGLGVAMRRATVDAGSFRGGMTNLAKTIGKGGVLAAGLFIFSEIAGSLADTKAMLDEVETGTRSLTDALIDNGGVWDENIEKQRTSAIIGSDMFQSLWKAGADYADLLKLAKGETSDFGKVLNQVNWDEVEGDVYKTGRAIEWLGATGKQEADALKLSAEAIDFEKAQKSAAGAREEADRYTSSLEMQAAAAAAGYDSIAEWALATEKSGGAASVASAELDELAKAEAEAAAEAEAVRAAMTPMERALSDAADAAGELGDLTNYLVDEIARLNGRVPTAEEAIKDLHAAFEGMADAADDGDGKIKNWGDVVDLTTGQINLGTKAGRDLSDEMNELSEKALANAAAQAQLAGATGGSAAAADAARNATLLARQEFIASHAQLGLTKDQAIALADAYLGIPDEVATAVVASSNFAEIDAELSLLEQKTYMVKVGGKWTGVTGAPNNFRGDVVPMAYTGGLFTDSGIIRGYAGGGIPSGFPFAGVAAPANPRQDNILVGLAGGGQAMIRPDEFLVNAASSRKYRDLLWQINADRVPGYAMGGIPAGSSSPVSVTATMSVDPNAPAALQQFLAQYVRVEVKAAAREMGNA